MDLETGLSVALFAGLLLLVLLDRVRPARVFPRPRFWRTRGMIGLVLFLAVTAATPRLWDRLLAEHRLMDATSLNPWLGGLAGVLAIQFASYWWHRALHRVPFLWRHFHQMHHSAERVDIYGAFYFHPLDLIGFAFAGSLALIWGIGVSPEAALIANSVVAFCTMFQHSNLNTPAWLGLIVQRPENHAVHHERGVHAFNYGDLSIWDIVFGTFRNPAIWNGQAGFWNGASNRIVPLLLGQDVSAPPRRASEPPPELPLSV